MVSIHLPAFADHIAGRDPARLEPERRVLAGMQARRPIARQAADAANDAATFSDRLADRVGAVGGSWGFIIVFAAVRPEFPPGCER